MNERLEIEGDTREDIRNELERIEGYEHGPQILPPTDEEMEAHFQDWSIRQ